MKKKVLTVLGVVLLLIIGIATRFIDHPANFVPMGAIAIIAGYYFSGKSSVFIPLGIMFLSDLIIGFYHGPVMLSVYGSYLMIWGISRYSRRLENKLALMPVTLLSSLLFFALTNAAVWWFTPLYSNDLAGLVNSYTLALPFFKWTVISDILYTGIFVASIEAIRYAMRVRSPKKVINFNS